MAQQAKKLEQSALNQEFNIVNQQRQLNQHAQRNNTKPGTTTASHTTPKSTTQSKIADDSPKTVRHKAGPLELKSVAELNTLLSNEDNAVILFYKDKCPWCEALKPVYKKLANEIHKTNLEPGMTRIVVAQIDGYTMKDEINQLRPGFLGDPKKKRGYPTLLFKKADGTAHVWDPEIERSEQNLSEFMGYFFQDPSLIPDRNDLSALMNNNDPVFVYYYTDAVPVIPRFVNPLDENMIDLIEGIKTLNYLFLVDGKLRKHGAAFPVNRMDRPDVSALTIYDRRDQKAYPYRDAVRWIKKNYNDLTAESSEQ